MTLYKCFVSQDKPCKVLKKIWVCLKVAAAEKADEQKNNVVFEFCPKEHGFLEVLPGDKIPKNLMSKLTFRRIQVAHDVGTAEGL